MMGLETVGSFFVDKQGEIWQQVSWTDRPTVIMRKVSDPSVNFHGVVGAPNMVRFTRLVMEDDCNG